VCRHGKVIAYHVVYTQFNNFQSAVVCDRDKERKKRK
jgi:hypothetical protein